MLDKRLLLVSGKGGVGKSAVAASLALVAQRRGLRVLAVEMESGRGLSDHFAVGELAFRPREVRPGLHAMHMSRSEALMEYLSLQLHIPGVARLGRVARAFDALATAAPAIREIVAIGKILWEVREDKWDLVVVDAPPTGQVASYLRAPKSISELVSSGRINDQADWMAGTLQDPKISGLILVNTPDELPVAESVETANWVHSSGVVPTPVLIANRVIHPLDVEVEGSGVAGAMAALHQTISASHRRWLETLPPETALPHLFGLLTPSEVAARLSDEIEAGL